MPGEQSTTLLRSWSQWPEPRSPRSASPYPTWTVRTEETPWVRAAACVATMPMKPSHRPVSLSSLPPLERVRMSIQNGCSCCSLKKESTTSHSQETGTK